MGKATVFVRFANITMDPTLEQGRVKDMPVYGTKESPRALVGRKIINVELRNDRGEHQVWFETVGSFYIFFQPLTCCDTVTVDYLDKLDGIRGKTIKSIGYEEGLYTFTLRDGEPWHMAWISNKKAKRIPMVLLSRQDKKVK